MNLRWKPWRRASTDTLSIGSSPEALVWIHADRQGRLRRCGLTEFKTEQATEFARNVRGLALPTQAVRAVLPLTDGQLLQVEAPAVKPEEMKAAARWKIKDLVAGRVEDLTLDVMFVGPDEARPSRQIFVAAARNSSIRELAERTRAVGLELGVIELVETAQRNLHSAIAHAAGLGARATAALLLHGHQCLLTVCAGGELYYARRLEWDGGLVAPAPALAPLPTELALDNMDFVDYGAEPEAGASGAGEAPRLVVDLQRSFDVWERSWPNLPLAALWVQVGEGSEALAALLQQALGQRVDVLEPERVFPGFNELATTPELRAALLPVLGAVLRGNDRKL